MSTTSAITAEKTIFNRLVSSGVKNEVSLTGGIYIRSRPEDSKVEDIVVGTLAMNSDQVQEGVFNVNIHVPNLKLTNDNKQPDNDRFEVITEAVLAKLVKYTGYNYGFDIKTPGIPYRDGTNWFVNIAVEFWTLRRTS